MPENIEIPEGRFELSYVPVDGDLAGCQVIELFDTELATLERASVLRGKGNCVHLSIGAAYAHEYPEFFSVNGLLVSNNPAYSKALDTEAGVELVHFASSVRLLNKANTYTVEDLLDILDQWPLLEDSGETADEVSVKVGIAFLALLPEIKAALRDVQAIGGGHVTKDRPRVN